METNISAEYKGTPDGVEANEILRACVHCGFCNATCPTYRLLGDELDSPRGRIYLIKQAMEGGPVSRITQRHLDRCLICTACETTCPSGVRYHHLLRIGRDIVDVKVPRPLHQRLQRRVLRGLLPYPKRLSPVMGLGRILHPILPGVPRAATARPARAIAGYDHGRTKTDRMAAHPNPQSRVLILAGCVQSVATPETNAALERVLGKIGIESVHEPRAGCCGAIDYHLGAGGKGLAFMRKNIDAWWPHVEAGIQGIVTAASGCGTMLKDYGHIFRHDPRYAEKAARVSSLVMDPVSLLADVGPSGLGIADSDIADGDRRIAFHVPCTLNRQGVAGDVESLLTRIGFDLVRVADPHLCCGAAGTYFLLQPTLSRRLLDNKLACLEAESPALIATANVGCQLYLRSRARVPVVHWLELLDGRVP